MHGGGFGQSGGRTRASAEWRGLWAGQDSEVTCTGSFRGGGGDDAEAAARSRGRAGRESERGSCRLCAWGHLDWPRVRVVGAAPLSPRGCRAAAASLPEGRRCGDKGPAAGASAARAAAPCRVRRAGDRGSCGGASPRRASGVAGSRAGACRHVSRGGLGACTWHSSFNARGECRHV